MSEQKKRHLGVAGVFATRGAGGEGPTAYATNHTFARFCRHPPRACGKTRLEETLQRYTSYVRTLEKKS